MTTGVATQNNQTGIAHQVQESELISYLDTLGLTAKLSQPEKTAYLNIAKAMNLNPFKREIHVSKYGENMSIITGYEVYIKRAERTGQLDGWHATTSGSVSTNDLKATVTIYRKDRSHPFIWEALYEECVQTTTQGAVTKFWKKAAFMTKKVAISQAFRLCFSDELAGMPYTSDEISVQTEDVEYETVPLSNPETDIRSAGSLEELQDIYSKLSKEEKAKYKTLKDEMKDFFTTETQPA